MDERKRFTDISLQPRHSPMSSMAIEPNRAPIVDILQEKRFDAGESSKLKVEQTSRVTFRTEAPVVVENDGEVKDKRDDDDFEREGEDIEREGNTVIKILRSVWRGLKWVGSWLGTLYSGFKESKLPGKIATVLGGVFIFGGPISDAAILAGIALGHIPPLVGGAIFLLPVSLISIPIGVLILLLSTNRVRTRAGRLLSNLWKSFWQDTVNFVKNPIGTRYLWDPKTKNN